MKVKAVYEIILTLLLTSMLTLASSIQTVNAENSFWKEVATFSGSGSIQEDTDLFTIWDEEWRIRYSYEPLDNKSGEFSFILYQFFEYEPFLLKIWEVRKQGEEAGEQDLPFHSYFDYPGFSLNYYFLSLEMINVNYTIVIERYSTFVEVARFSGGGYVSDNTENFTITHVKWRIRSWYEPMSSGIFSYTIFWFEEGYVRKGGELTHRSVDRKFERLSTYYTEEVPRTYFLGLEMDDVYYTIIVEQDVTSNPQSTEDTTPPTISILFPENKTYPARDVSLTFTVSESTSWIVYSLDEQANITIAGNTTLTGLSDGMHSLVVHASDIAGNMGSSSMVYFTIQTVPIDTPPPSISIVSPENKTYDTTDIPLTFTVDESVSWMAYSLDNKVNVTVTGNTTLSGLSDGSHSLIVYAKDTAGNIGASEMVYFSTVTQQPEPQPAVPWQLWIIVAIVIIAVVGTGLLVYFTKVKKTTEKVK